MMQNNVLDYLEEIVLKNPNKIAYTNGTDGLTFKEVHDHARSIGTFLAQQGFYKEPVVIFMPKHPHTIAAFFGSVYGGNFYVPLDAEMPSFRIQLILEKLKPRAMICTHDTVTLVQSFDFKGQVYVYDDLIHTPIWVAGLKSVYERSIDTDPIYIVFTSGSTGIPKGVVACHRSVIDYIENLADVLGISESTIFGNQSPLYFDACLKELYPTLKFGATTYLIPKQLFMLPLKLVEYLNAYHINTICWVVSALTIISTLNVFKKIIPQHLHTIAFGSEVFPIKQFNKWREAVPDAQFIHLYGPTEATGMCCYFKVNRHFQEDERIPIGRPFKNTDLLILNDLNKRVQGQEVGEMCVRGTSLTLGYYDDFERTGEVFVQNPLNPFYPELIYRTGDLGKYNEQGELIFVSRKDFQIKHMGHRIELGEIEVCVHKLDAIQSACALYDADTQKILLYYVGTVEVAELMGTLKEMLPRYMLPNKLSKLDTMPLTPNGKIDRHFLKQL